MSGSAVEYAFQNRQALQERFKTIRQRSMQLAEPLTAEDQCIQGCFQASPTKWHLAHTSWFFETFILREFYQHYSDFNLAFNYLFNSYYNGVGAQYPRQSRGLLSRPALNEVTRYRRHIDDHLMHLIETSPASEFRQLEQRCELGLNHEQQHQELILTDIKTVLANNPTHPVYRELPLETGIAPELKWVEFDAGLEEIGARSGSFCFDNELPRHKIYVAPFQLASRPVTNAEYIQFIHAGGYQNPEHWLSDGWTWVTNSNWEAPMYWEFEAGNWYENTLGGRRSLQESAPVTHISYFEADAYARWRGYRLPSEAEWEVAASAKPVCGNLLDSKFLHPMPAAEGAEADLLQLYGDVWEWTRSGYAPYPGYKPLAGVLGEYNGKFMCGQYVLRGGSCATPRDHIRATYRNFFPPHERWQFTGIRLAGDLT